MLPPVTMSSSWSSNSWHPVSVSSRSTVLLMIFSIQASDHSLARLSVAGCCIRHREPVHWRCPSQTFRDGDHIEGADGRDPSHHFWLRPPTGGCPAPCGRK